MHLFCFENIVKFRKLSEFCKNNFEELYVFVTLPFEALLDDMYHEQSGGSQRAFGMKSFMVSVGGACGEISLKLQIIL